MVKISRQPQKPRPPAYSPLLDVQTSSDSRQQRLKFAENLCWIVFNVRQHQAVHWWLLSPFSRLLDSYSLSLSYTGEPEDGMPAVPTAEPTDEPAQDLKTVLLQTKPEGEALQHLIQEAIRQEDWRFFVWAFEQDEINREEFYNCMYLLFSPDHQKKFLDCLLSKDNENRFESSVHVFVFGLKRGHCRFLTDLMAKFSDDQFELGALHTQICYEYPDMLSWCDGSVLDELFNNLRQAPNESCVCFAVLVAYGRCLPLWNYICEVHRVGRFKVIAGASMLFESAIVTGQFECGGRILQSALSHSNYGAVSDMTRRLDEFHSGPGYWTPECTRSLTDTCTFHYLYASAALLNILCKEWREAGRALQLETCQAARTTVLYETWERIFSSSRWNVLVRILHNRAPWAIVTRPQVPDLLTSACLVMDRNAKAQIRELVRHCRDPLVIGKVLCDAIEACDRSLFNQVVALGLVNMTTLGEDFPFFQHMLKAHTYIWIESNRRSDFMSTVHGNRLRAIFKTCVEMGMCELERQNPHICLLSAHLDRDAPIHFPLVRILLKIGLTTHAELFWLTRQQSRRQHLRNIGKTNVLRYLDRAARTPLSLKDISRLAVSKSIGCHPDRKSRILTLYDKIPRTLIPFLSFHDVLYR